MFFEDLLNAGKMSFGRRNITQSQIDAFAVAGGDENPLHKGSHQAIAHGELMAAVLTAFGAQLIGYENIFRHNSTNTEFKAPMRPGDVVSSTMSLKDVIVDKRRLAVASFSVQLGNQDGTLLAEGERVLTVLKKPSK